MTRGTGDTPFELQSRTVGALPIVGAFLERLGIGAMLEDELPTDPRAQLSVAQSLGVLLFNIVCERAPLYALGEWVANHDEVALGIDEGDGRLINDDWTGRALDRLFDCDRAALVTRIALSAIRHFQVATDELHNDSTSITLQGDYAEADGGTMRGKPTVAAARGHSKDHRPDLKQLLWVLTVSSDFAVPVHYRLYDGNTSDTEPHTEIWDTLVTLVGKPGFLYVADSKLATGDNMGHIASNNGRFLTVLPRTRSEDGDFRRWVRTNDPDWVLVRDNGVDADGLRDSYLMWEAPWPSKEGYRVAWVLSTAKRHHHGERRRARNQGGERGPRGPEGPPGRPEGPHPHHRCRHAGRRRHPGRDLHRRLLRYPARVEKRAHIPSGAARAAHRRHPLPAHRSQPHRLVLRDPRRRCHRARRL